MSSNTNSNAPFNWISQQLFDSLDSVNNIRLGVFLESGLSGTPNENMGLSNTPARLSLKLKDNKTNNKMDIELSYTELFMLNTKLPQLFKKQIPNFKIDVFSKQKKRTLSFSITNGQAYVLAMSDNSNISQSLQFVFSIPGFLAFGSIIKQVFENWILTVFNLNTVSANHRIICDINKLNDSVTRLQIQKNNFTTKTNIEVPKANPITQHIVEKIEDNIFDDVDIQLEDSNEQDCPFDIDVDEIVTPTSNETIVIDESFINTIDLESKENTVPKNVIRKVIQPRPFINNFMEWDLENLFNWVSAFSVVNKTSNDISFKPLELILSKSIGLDNAKHLTDSSDFYYMNYHILNSLKTNIMAYINNKTGRFTRSFNKFFFSDVSFVTKESQKELWDFIVDIAYLDMVFKYFNFNINKFDLKMSDETSSLYSIKLAESFIDTFAQSLVKLIDPASHEIFKTDINNLFLMFDDKETFDILSNSYNYATKGGTFKVELSSINKYMDKYIDTIHSIDATSSEFHKLCEINNLDDMKLQFFGTETIEPEIDKETKLFLKALNLELIDDSIFTDIKTFSEIEDKVKTVTNENIVKIFNIIKNNPNIKKVSEVQRLINSVEESSEVLVETIIEKAPVVEVVNKPIDMFSIDDDDTDFDIFDLQKSFGE